MLANLVSDLGGCCRLHVYSQVRIEPWQRKRAQVAAQPSRVTHMNVIASSIKSWAVIESSLGDDQSLLIVDVSLRIVM